MQYFEANIYESDQHLFKKTGKKVMTETIEREIEVGAKKKQS